MITLRNYASFNETVSATYYALIITVHHHTAVDTDEACVARNNTMEGVDDAHVVDEQILIAAAEFDGSAPETRNGAVLHSEPVGVAGYGGVDPIGCPSADHESVEIDGHILGPHLDTIRVGCQIAGEHVVAGQRKRYREAWRIVGRDTASQGLGLCNDKLSMSGGAKGYGECRDG